MSGIIKLKEDCAFYRAVIAGDITFKFEIDFTQTDDIAFDLEICAEEECDINWEGNIEWDTPCAAVSAGVTKIRFEKDICNEIFRGNLIQMPKPQDVRLLTATSNDDIQPNFIAHHNGSGWNAYRFFRSSDYSNYMSFYNPQGTNH